MTKGELRLELKAKTCYRIISQGGNCVGNDCGECPFCEGILFYDGAPGGCTVVDDSDHIVAIRAELWMVDNGFKEMLGLAKCERGIGPDLKQKVISRLSRLVGYIQLDLFDLAEDMLATSGEEDNGTGWTENMYISFHGIRDDIEDMGDVIGALRKG